MEYTTEEASALLQVTPQHVAGLCRRGRIHARLVEGKWLIPDAEVTRFKRTRRAGRPPGREAKTYAGKSIGRRRARVRQMIAEGSTNDQIAALLGVNPATVARDKKTF